MLSNNFFYSHFYTGNIGRSRSQSKKKSGAGAEIKYFRLGNTNTFSITLCPVVYN